MNSSIRKAIRKRDSIHYKAKSTNRPEHWLRYRQTRNDVISLVRLAKDEYKKKLTSQLTDKTIPPLLHCNDWLNNKVRGLIYMS
jgi:hypothetical protein